MTIPADPDDLVLLVADKNMLFAVDGILNRPQSLSIRPIVWKSLVHPESDPGCLLRADAFLRPFANRYLHAIVMLDREGCGRQQRTSSELEQDIEKSMARSGWSERAAAIVIDPELENWIWSDSPEVEMALGWRGRDPQLRQWLAAKGFLSPDRSKPLRPKEAMEETLRFVRKPRSSSIYLQLAQRVGFTRCDDPAFHKLKNILVSWFPSLNAV
ncbi:MAG: hypothetical protein L3J03_05020 [Desulfobacterales bacterium]|nr:hypothetical protein [Desulfobacterales bacterium]